MALSAADIQAILEPYLAKPEFPASRFPHLLAQEHSTLGIPSDAFEKLAVYLELLLRWNLRLSLTSVRTPLEIVRRHFGESLFLASKLGRLASILDFGSGAGFPGVPIQIYRPDIQVTLAESHLKKASFLSEVVRILELRTDVWPRRVEELGKTRNFDAITIRAVEKMPRSVATAANLLPPSIFLLCTEGTLEDLSQAAQAYSQFERWRVPESEERVLSELRSSAPRDMSL